MRLKQEMRRNVALALALGWALGGAAQLRAEEAQAADQTFDFFLQEAQVTTASRRVQKKSDSPVAIDVITAEDIASSGAQNIGDLLRYRVGVNVSEGEGIEGNRQVVNVRGLPDEFAQSLLVLVDGRSIMSPVDQGVFWDDIPVALDDIERIEIVRGPNSALFGSNAGQGVINIITKKATGDTRISANGAIGSYQAYKGYGSLELPTLAGNIRVSFQQSARMAGWPGPNGVAPPTGNEDVSFQRLNARMDSMPWNGAELETFVGGNKDIYNLPPILGISSSAYNGDYEMLKLSQKLSDGLSLELNASRDDDNRGVDQYAIRETQYSGELLARLASWAERSQSVIGVSYRNAVADSAYIFNEFTPGDGAKAQDRVERGFVSESLGLTDWATLSAAASYENSDIAGSQGAYQGALVLKPLEDWSLRVSASRAPTLPSLLNTNANIRLLIASIPNGGGPGITLNEYYHVEGGQVAAANVSSYEATFSGTLLDKKLSAEITPYQMDIEGYPEFNSLGNVPGFVPPSTATVDVTTQYQNNYSLVLRGVETSLTYKPMLGTKIELNHTYENVYQNDRQGGAKRYVYTTPWNIVNAVLSSELLWGFNGAVNLGWTGEHIAYLASRSSSVFVPDQARLDLRLGYAFGKGAEVYVLGQNMLAQYRVESGDGTAVPQAYYAGLNLAWGAK